MLAPAERQFERPSYPDQLSGRQGAAAPLTTPAHLTPPRNATRSILCLWCSWAARRPQKVAESRFATEQRASSSAAADGENAQGHRPRWMAAAQSPALGSLDGSAERRGFWQRSRGTTHTTRQRHTQRGKDTRTHPRALAHAREPCLLLFSSVSPSIVVCTHPSVWHVVPANTSKCSPRGTSATPHCQRRPLRGWPEGRRAPRRSGLAVVAPRCCRPGSGPQSPWFGGRASRWPAEARAPPRQAGRAQAAARACGSMRS